MKLAGSGTSDPRWLEKIIKHPPTSLETLEYWVGSLELADADRHGVVVRPENPPRGALRRGVRRLLAQFPENRYRSTGVLQGFSLDLDIAYVHVAQVLEAQLGPGRTFSSIYGAVVEYGTWFYLRDSGDGSAFVQYAQQRPEWAIPPAPRGVHENLLATLHDRLICDRDLVTLFEALKPLAADDTIELRDWNRGQISINFRPAIPLAMVLQTFRWENPVASSGGVHMQSWTVHPHRPDLPWDAPHINHWRIDVYIDGWPRGAGGSRLPKIARAGASALIDARACTNAVISIAIVETG
jgi:hypothetical protein